MAITRSRSRPVTPRTVISASSLSLTCLSSATTTTLRASKSNVVPVTPSPTKSRKRKPSPSPSRSPPSTNLLPTTSLKSLWTRSAVATINPNQPYLDLEVPPEELRPSATLTTGQSFVWKVVVNDEAETYSQTQSAWGTHDATEWIGILRISKQLSAVVAIRETPTTTLYRPLISSLPSEKTDWKQVLRHYFQLDHSLPPLYEGWSQADPRLATIAKCIPGVRILNQDPWECLVSFICSSNNNIPRITKMVNAIRKEFGTPLLSEQEHGGPETLYAFPSLDDLSKASDLDLREKCGLGYRAKYIGETIQILQGKGGESYLQELKQMTDPLQVQTCLCEFSGVGRKVADCVALFSLQQENAIPVDVHVWNIARRDFDPDHQLAQIKSLTPTTYQQVGDVFRQRFPLKAGWAHSLLFVAELPSFRPILPEHIVKEMEHFQREEKVRKQETRDARKKKRET